MGSSDPHHIRVDAACTDGIGSDFDPGEAFITEVGAPGVLDVPEASGAGSRVVSVTNNRHSMVSASLAVDVVSADNAAVVELKSSAKEHSSSDGSFDDLGFDGLSVTSIDPAPANRSPSDDLVLVMSARVFPVIVRIVALPHNSLLLLEQPPFAHMAAKFASMSLVSLSEQPSVGITD